MFSFLLDLLFPVSCLGCGQPKEFLCRACLEQIPPSKKTFIRFKNQALDGLIIGASYRESLVKHAVHCFKYNFIRTLAEPLAELTIRGLKNSALVFENKNSVLVPVPLHQRRLRWRGFNQAEELAKSIGRKTNIPVVANLVVRTKNTAPQAKIDDIETREQNLAHAFCLANQKPKEEPKGCIPLGIHSTKISGKTVFLIDDVATTGATLEQCARALKPLCPKQVWGLVVAKG